MKFKKFIKESIEDMDRRCPECNTLLNDGGTCPKCDDGEEDYGDEIPAKIDESTQHTELSNKEKLMRAFPGEFNFDTSTSITEDVQQEELTNKEKLLKAYPELNFDNDVITEEKSDSTSIEEDLSAKEKLERAYPGVFNFDNIVEAISDDEYDDDDKDYDDDFDFDDVEEDRRHASLYGGDLTYCKHCGRKLARDEWGGYCPDCDSEEFDDTL